MLYAMFFFLRDGEGLLERALYYIPLRTQDELRMVDKFVSITRATLKGSLVIGVLQGALAGLAFAVAGAGAAGVVRILNCANVATSFPDFSNFAQRVGMKLSEEKTP